MQKKYNKTNSAAKTAKAPEVKAEVKETVKEAAKKVEAEVKEAAKKVETVAETTAKKAGTKTEEVVETAAEDAKRAVKKTAKKAVVKKEKEAAKTEFVLQFQNSEINLASIEEKVKAKFVAEGHRAGCIRNLNIYVKPEEYKAYYVINDGKFAGQVDFF